MTNRNLYLLLDVEREASPAQLKRAYEMALSRANREGATKHMVDVVKAYEVLSDPQRRAYYDQTGFGVVPERVPNTYGRPVAWRGGVVPRVGHDRAAATGFSVLPGRATPRFGVGKRLGIGVAVATVVATVFWAGARSVSPQLPLPTSPPTLSRVVCPATPAGPAYSFLARPGSHVSCAGGGVPIWR